MRISPIYTIITVITVNTLSLSLKLYNPFTIIRPYCPRSRTIKFCACNTNICSFIHNIPQYLMNSIIPTASNALGSDVIAVIGPNGLFSTDFYVKFSLSLYKPSSLDGLAIDGSDVLDSSIPMESNSFDHVKTDDTSLSSERKVNYDDERLQLLKLGPEWVDVYCNDVICKDVSAVIGVNGLLFFVEDKKLSLVPSGSY